MPRGLYIDRPGHVTLKEYDDPPLADDQYRLLAELASIKHGTTFHTFSGRSPFQERRFDGDLRLFVPRDPGAAPADAEQFVGNMVVGTVAEVGRGVERVRVGQRVYAYGPARQTLTLRQNEGEPLEPPMTAADALCLDPALMAYAAVRDARVCVGDNVVVVGLGAIGLMIVQLLRLAGCLNVVAADPVARRRELARGFGADPLLDPAGCDVAMEVRQRLGRGADIAIEASGHYAALAAAIRAAGQCARVVTLGYYKGRDSQLELGAEFFHNRLELIASLPAWKNSSREHPLWDNARLVRTLIEMFRAGRLTSRGMLDPVVDLAEAPEAFLRAYRDPAYAVKLGIRFPE